MLFVAYRPHLTVPGIPVFIDRIYTESFNEKKPMEPIFNEFSPDFLNYNSNSDGVPAPANMQFPSHLIMVCKGLRKLASDFYADSIDRWIVSERFYAFMKEHKLLEQQYEVCQLTVVATSNKPISNRQYYLLRFFQKDDELVDFAHSPSIKSTKKPLTKKSPQMLYYPELVFYPNVTVPPMLFLEMKCFRYGFICNSEIKEQMDREQFLGFDFYTLSGYVQEQLYREQHPNGPAKQ